MCLTVEQCWRAQLSIRHNFPHNYIASTANSYNYGSGYSGYGYGY